MNPRISGILLMVITAACFIAGAIVYPTLPPLVISHWNAAGAPNHYGSKAWVVFLLPAIMLILTGLWALLPRIDPIRKGFVGFRHAYDFFWILLTAFFAYAYALMLGANVGWQFDFLEALMPALAVLIFVLGSLMPYLKRNWFFGIRTPWTLSNDVVWDKTHELGGRLFQAAGIIIGIGSFFGRSAALWTLILPVIAAALASVVYSYIEYRRIEKP